MSKDDPKETRKASLLLSGLVLTPDKALETFRERRAADPTLDLAHLSRAKDILVAISRAITSSDAEGWARIEAAWAVLCGDAESPDGVAPADAETAPTDAAAEADEPIEGGAAAPAAEDTGADATATPAAAPQAEEGAASPAPEAEAADAAAKQAEPLPASGPQRPARVDAPPPSHLTPPSGLPIDLGKGSPWVMGKGEPSQLSHGAPVPVTPEVTAPAPPAPPARVTTPSSPSLPDPPSSPDAAPPPSPSAPAVAQGSSPGAEPPAVAPAPPAAATAPSDEAPGERLAIDVEALNRVKLDMDRPATLPVDDMLMSRQALPFQGRGAPPPLASSDETEGELEHLNETAALSALNLTAATLPFEKPTAPDSSEAATTPDDDDQDPLSATTPRPRTPPAVENDSTDTTTSLDSPPVKLTAEQYAAFCAERKVYSDRVPAICARYQVGDEAQARRLDDYWQARLARDSALGQQHARTVEHYCKWLRDRARG